MKVIRIIFLNSSYQTKATFLHVWIYRPVFLPFLARLYESTESYCCHFNFGVDIALGWALASHFKILFETFLCYGQGTVR